MTEKNNIRIIFTEKADLVLEQIMERFNLEESLEELAKINREGKLFKVVIMNRLVRDFAKEIISKEELIESLQKDLKISQQTAETISKDIINNLVPLLEKIPEEQLKKQPFIEQVPIENLKPSEPVIKIKPPIGIPRTGEIYKPADNKKDFIIKKPKDIGTEKINGPFQKEKKRKDPLKQSEKIIKKQSDSYREPIE